MKLRFIVDNPLVIQATKMRSKEGIISKLDIKTYDGFFDEIGALNEKIRSDVVENRRFYELTTLMALNLIKQIDVIYGNLDVKSLVSLTKIELHLYERII
jgi:hypothetical protein